MYKFTNGHIVYDKTTADSYIRAGYKLVETQKELPKETMEDEINEERNTSNKFIEKSNKASKKPNRKN